jgi:hypothetical protein
VRDTLHAPHAQAHARDVLLRIGAQPTSAHLMAAGLRAATRYYEQHVIAWHALGRLSEARVAREDIAHYSQKLDAEPDQSAIPPIGLSAAASHQDAPRVAPGTSDVRHGSRPTIDGLAASRLRGSDGVSRARDAAETTLVTLRLDLATATISGTLADEQGDERPFWGWLEFSEALDEIRGAEARLVDAPWTPERGSEK